MWPHFETLRWGTGEAGLGAGGGRGDMHRRGGGCVRVCVWWSGGGGLFYDGTNIIFSTRTLLHQDPRAELRRLECRSH